VCLHKRALGEHAITTRRNVEHLDDRVDVLCHRERGRHGFCGVSHQCVCSVHIQIQDIGNIRRDAAAREPRHIRQRVLQSRKIVVWTAAPPVPK